MVTLTPWFPLFFLPLLLEGLPVLGCGTLRLLPSVAVRSLPDLSDDDYARLQSQNNLQAGQTVDQIDGFVAGLVFQSLHVRPCLVTEGGHFRLCVPHY